MLIAQTGITFGGRRFAAGEEVEGLPESVERRLIKTGALKDTETGSRITEVRESQEGVLPAWPLDMGPLEYLERFPEGQYADLARRWVPFYQYADEGSPAEAGEWPE